MFVSKNRMERAEMEIEHLQNELRKLTLSHWRLLQELGYSEETVFTHTKLVKAKKD